MARTSNSRRRNHHHDCNNDHDHEEIISSSQHYLLCASSTVVACCWPTSAGSCLSWPSGATLKCTYSFIKALSNRLKFIYILVRRVICGILFLSLRLLPAGLLKRRHQQLTSLRLQSDRSINRVFERPYFTSKKRTEHNQSNKQTNKQLYYIISLILFHIIYPPPSPPHHDVYIRSRASLTAPLFSSR